MKPSEGRKWPSFGGARGGLLPPHAPRSWSGMQREKATDNQQHQDAAQRAPGIHEITSWFCRIKEQFGCIKRALELLLSHIHIRLTTSCQKQSTQSPRFELIQ